MHAPETHVWFEQGVPLCHVPDESHCWGVLPEHCFVDGRQEPLHVALLHTFAHAEPRFCHVPVLLHCWGCWPLQRLSPGVHTPVQPLFAHTKVQACVCGA